jgi:hypothetical protein
VIGFRPFALPLGGKFWLPRYMLHRGSAGLGFDCHVSLPVAVLPVVGMAPLPSHDAEDGSG